MKLYYDRKSPNPTYFIQQGIRNGKKTTTTNVKRIGRHSELLAITTDPFEYAKQQVEIFNREYREGKIDISIKFDFEEKLTATDDVASKSTALNIGYFILQHIYHDLKLGDFFREAQGNTKATFDCDTVSRFLTFARVLNPASKLDTFERLEIYYEQPSFDYQQFVDIVQKQLFYWLNRRSQKNSYTWDEFKALKERVPILLPRLRHNLHEFAK